MKLFGAAAAEAGCPVAGAEVVTLEGVSMRRGLAVVVVAIVSAVTLVITPADAQSQGTAQPSVDTPGIKFGENDRLTSYYERGSGIDKRESRVSA